MDLRDFHGPNAGYILELYERFRRDPSSVDPASRTVFERWRPEPDGGLAGAETIPAVSLERAVKAANLSQAVREYGHLGARLDPLGRKPPGETSLSLEFHGLTEDDLRALPAGLVGGPATEGARDAEEAIRRLREMYSGTLGYDCDHLRSADERRWLRDAAESRRFYPSMRPADPVALLSKLTQVEVFERFLHRAFPGKYRFSIEGLDVLIPMLDEVLQMAIGAGACTILIGMAHRGRLNVLAHILNKPYSQILAEFKDPIRPAFISSEVGYTGDVKYHKGARRELRNGDPTCLVVTIPPNPSHLEAIDPVLEGMTRAAGTTVDKGGQLAFNPKVTLPILVHGDAAFPGQGVVAETLNLSRLCGYWTGGTLHIIANNQLGFTTMPYDSRSTLHASDLAKGFEIPVVHVNADDPEACLAAARLAFAYRDKFHKDFVIDLIGYRRHGHNEGDEPSFTQPVMYKTVTRHPTVRELWAKALEERGVVKGDEADKMVAAAMEVLQRELETLEPAEDLQEQVPATPPPGAARKTKTAVPLERLRTLNRALVSLPERFRVHPKLEKLIARRREALDDPDASSVDWAIAEGLALASILEDGIAVRMTGQDIERGTFSQHNAVFYDAEDGKRFVPLQALPKAGAPFEIYNSPLSENAALAFEYGYNIQEPGRLVLWEAQYGDFINGAQTVVDEFLVSARSKWGQTPSLVMLLPHGYEGAGPDHSSARLERFLRLAAETNLRLAYPTTAAQYFHLLRRQAALLGRDPLPLVVLTPKSLLRNAFSASRPVELAKGGWEPVLPDTMALNQPERIEQVLICSGKFGVDLLTSDRKEAHPETAIVRMEQIYPFPADALLGVLKRFSKLKVLKWVQEEPRNMGALGFWNEQLNESFGQKLRSINERLVFGLVARSPNSSPAEGSSSVHANTQASLISRSFGDEAEPELRSAADAQASAR